MGMTKYAKKEALLARPIIHPPVTRKQGHALREKVRNIFGRITLSNLRLSSTCNINTVMVYKVSHTKFLNHNCYF
jgi:hypothetical protein